MASAQFLVYLFQAAQVAFVTISDLWTWLITPNSLFGNSIPLIFICGGALVVLIIAKIVIHFVV